MIRAMTGFASATGQDGRWTWAWDIRSVNGKGLDVRLRVPVWIEGLEATLRARLAKAVTRGSVSVSLRITQGDGAAALTLNAGQLSAVLDALAAAEAEAMERGITLGPSTAADILGLRGVLDSSSDDGDTARIGKAVMADIEPLVAAFVAMRDTEGAALTTLLLGQLDTIWGLVEAAAEVAAERHAETAAALRASLARILDNADGVDEGRVAQELAMIAVKQDVTEELDRLRAHVEATRDLIAGGGAVGRKLDFLMQEFNREANTLCSKSQNKALTAVGLDLKAVIDQMREQAHNVE